MRDTEPMVLWLHFCKYVFIKAINRIIFCRSYSDKYGSPGGTSYFITSNVNTSNFRSKKLEASRSKKSEVRSKKSEVISRKLEVGI